MNATRDTWVAADGGDVGEMERLVGQDPGLLNAKLYFKYTPLMLASEKGHEGLVRWLLDKGAAINERQHLEMTALWLACRYAPPPVVQLLLERGADPSIAREGGGTPLIAGSSEGRLEVVRLLIGHPSGKATINQRDNDGRTALWGACFFGRVGVVTALLEGGADPTIADNCGTTPTAAATEKPNHRMFTKGRSECVAALEVRLYRCELPCLMIRWLRRAGFVVLGPGLWQEAERAYLLWKARQVADQQRSGAVAVEGKEGGARKAVFDFVVHDLKGDLFPELVDFMWGGGCPQGVLIPVVKARA
jgi:hypothetical protein